MEILISIALLCIIFSITMAFLLQINKEYLTEKQKLPATTDIVLFNVCFKKDIISSPKIKAVNKTLFLDNGKSTVKWTFYPSEIIRISKQDTSKFLLCTDSKPLIANNHINISLNIKGYTVSKSYKIKANTAINALSNSTD
ncbi:MAG: hypothetical protein ACEPOV_10320 [Hyphomicrobiales bacterium]